MSDSPRCGSITAAKATADFLDYCRTGRGLAEHTMRAYASDLTDFLRHTGRRKCVAAIDREAIRVYVRALQDRKLKETTIRRRLATLKLLFRWLEDEEVVPLSVFHRLNLAIRLPRRLPRALRNGEIRALLRARERRSRCIGPEATYRAMFLHFVVVALFTTGLRVGELVDVRLADIDIEEGSIHVRGKGNRERRVYMSGSQALAVMRRFASARRRLHPTIDHLLVGPSGKPITTQRIRSRLSNLARRAGIGRRVTPHMLRHTAATQLLEAGVDIRFVQQLLGHASIATTQIYTQVSNASLREKLTQANTLRRVS